MQAAALVGLAGTDPRQFLFTHDSDRAVVLQAIGQEAEHIRQVEREDLANRIISALSVALKKGKGRS